MNNKFIHTLDKWYIYLAWAAAAVFVWVWAVSAVVAPTEKKPFPCLSVGPIV